MNEDDSGVPIRGHLISALQSMGRIKGATVHMTMKGNAGKQKVISTSAQFMISSMAQKVATGFPLMCSMLVQWSYPPDKYHHIESSKYYRKT